MKSSCVNDFWKRIVVFSVTVVSRTLPLHVALLTATYWMFQKHSYEFYLSRIERDKTSVTRIPQYAALPIMLEQDYMKNCTRGLRRLWLWFEQRTQERLTGSFL